MSLTRLQISASLAPVVLPAFYVTATESSAISQLRLVDWNLAADDVATVLYDVDGDTRVFVDAARETDGIEDVEVPRSTGGSGFVLVTATPDALPFFRTFLVLTARAGLLVRSPVTYSDFETRGEVVGDAEALQAAVDTAPQTIDVSIEEIGSQPSVRMDPLSALSIRQREAVRTAFEHGYYRHPRETTHAELADELGCAPNTVSEHLQKAEVKLIKALVP
ncbi:helix-turn-helix domain-containing protein [Halobacterium sp. R2-5]|uniref:helix-turn-helix domain-containing protein n=1 Tax=Halobacterium sp. R2-5 TaxID=2715751 RepID=UPI00141E1457|nr:bacterio-opsin activator [Halobacterium sp. R2-5]